jgi:hypothetical protein
MSPTIGRKALTRLPVETLSVEPKQVMSVITAPRDMMLGAVHKNGAGEFTLNRLPKVTV